MSIEVVYHKTFSGEIITEEGDVPIRFRIYQQAGWWRLELNEHYTATLDKDEIDSLMREAIEPMIEKAVKNYLIFFT